MTSLCKKSTIASRFVAIALLCLAVLTGFRPGNPAPPKDKPFRGTYEGSVTVPAGTQVLNDVSFTVTGTASLLGRFQMANVADIDLTTLASAGTTTLTAANGDELYTTYFSAGTDNGDGTYTVDGEHVITGGTGRFEGATGSFTTTSLATMMTTPETVTIAGKVYITGAISY